MPDLIIRVFVACLILVAVCLVVVAALGSRARRVAVEAEAQRVIDGADQLQAMRRQEEAWRIEQRRRALLAAGPWRKQTRSHLAPTRLDLRALRIPSGAQPLVQARLAALRPPMPPVRAVVPWTAVMPEVT